MNIIYLRYRLRKSQARKYPHSSLLIDDPIVRTHAVFDVDSHLVSHHCQKQNVSILFTSLSLSRIDSLNRSHLTELSFDIDNRVLMYRVQFNRQTEGERR